MSFTGNGTPGASDRRTGAQEPPASGEQTSAPPAVELRNISKDFGSNRALDNVDLRIGQGEVVGLVGQNGSGKSTLVKVLSGVHEPEPGGRLFVSGEEVPLPLPPGQASEASAPASPTDSTTDRPPSSSASTAAEGETTPGWTSRVQVQEACGSRTGPRSTTP